MTLAEQIEKIVFKKLNLYRKDEKNIDYAFNIAQSIADKLVVGNSVERNALNKIIDLDPDKDSDKGFNEWGEADCFRRAQKIAKEALSQSKNLIKIKDSK